MEQRDYILREIEKISILLLALIGKLKSLTQNKLFEQERGMIDDQLEEFTGMDIDKLLSLSHEELRSSLGKEKGFDLSNLENLSELLTLMADRMNLEEAIMANSKALLILEWIDEESKTFSLERRSRMMEIKDKI